MTVDSIPSSANQNGLTNITSQKTTSQPDKIPIPHLNPFDVIRDDLGFLASGHGLVLEDEVAGQEVQGLRMGGREWERLVGRLKGFLRESNESEYNFGYHGWILGSLES